jgi:peptide/nickel transport system substrate-binding protein
MNDNLYYRWLNFNVSGGGNPALADRKVRQALNHAIDRDFLVALIHRGYASPGVQIIQKASGYWFNDNLTPYKFDLEYSKQLLKEAGYIDRDGDGIRENEDDVSLEITLMVINRWPEELKSAEQIKQWWQKIGVKLNIQSAEAGTILSKTVPLEHDMYFWGFSGNPDPTFSLNIMLERQIGMWNGSGYANPVYDALFDAQRKEIDPKDRQAIIYHMQEIVHQDAPHAVLYYMKSIGAYRADRFEGFVNMPTGILSQLNSFSLRNVHQTN